MDSTIVMVVEGEESELVVVEFSDFMLILFDLFINCSDSMSATFYGDRPFHT